MAASAQVAVTVYCTGREGGIGEGMKGCARRGAEVLGFQKGECDGGECFEIDASCHRCDGESKEDAY